LSNSFTKMQEWCCARRLRQIAYANGVGWVRAWDNCRVFDLYSRPNFKLKRAADLAERRQLLGA